jgi:hypothetical protein
LHSGLGLQSRQSASLDVSLTVSLGVSLTGSQGEPLCDEQKRNQMLEKPHHH